MAFCNEGTRTPQVRAPEIACSIGVCQQLAGSERLMSVAFTIEASLVEAARSQAGALEALIGAVWPDAYRLAYGILYDRGLAEDAAQEACAAMAMSLNSLNRPEAFRSWFCRLVVNESISANRRRREVAAPPDEICIAAAPDSTDALDLAIAIRALSPEQRAIVLLHYFAGLNSREIAEAARIPASTVRFHLMKARNALRRALADSTASSSSEAFSNAHGLADS